jgi:hypothetical protein
MLALVLGKCQNSNMKNTQYEKKLLRLVKKLHKNLGQAVALIEEASWLIDYEDEKNPSYGIKCKCVKFIKKMRKDWQ